MPETTDEPNLSPTMERFLNGRDDKLHEDEPLHPRRANPGTTDPRESGLVETLRAYPGTRPEALIYFARVTGLWPHALGDADFEWARRIRDGLAATEG